MRNRALRKDILCFYILLVKIEEEEKESESNRKKGRERIDLKSVVISKTLFFPLYLGCFRMSCLVLVSVAI